MEGQLKLIPQNEVDAAFMEELKDAISDRNATLDEVIELIRKRTNKIWVTEEQRDFSEHLIVSITALKS